MTIFSNTERSEKKPLIAAGWKVLIVDDEPGMHSITKLVLADFAFENKGLELLSAYSGEEAKKVIAEHPDIALIYLDVVMETDDAGLQFVKYLREEVGNRFVRIVLRTGQPGNAPERDVIVNYDINDYKEKTNFDSTKLFTTTFSALRAYQDIMRLEESRKSLDRYRIGLEKVIESSANLFEIRSLKQFAREILVQFGSIMHIDQDALVSCHGWTVTQSEGVFQVLAGTGPLHEGVEKSEELPGEVEGYLNRACQQKKSINDGDKYVGYYPTKSGKIYLIYLDSVPVIDELNRRLLEIFSSNVAVAFENLYLDKELYETQSEIINILGDVVESRSNETANHVKRVSHFSRMLARLNGMSEDETEMLFMAAPMHDVGKVAIPDRILLKAGKLDADEWEQMKTHAEIGASMLSSSKRPVLQAAAIIAGEHHEKFDGTGYPRGLQGHDIHIYGRIVAVADVFDALAQKRCYKEAWPLEDILVLLREQKGKHFDPELVELFLGNIEEVKHILATYP